MVRKLRISVTVLCLAACVAMIVLWVHSYYSGFTTHFLARQLNIVSWKGMLEINPTLIMAGSGIQRNAIFEIPYLSVVLLLLTVAGLPWVQWSRSYGIRALLIMMTLLAILLGILANSK